MNRTLNIVLLWVTSAALLADLAFIGYLIVLMPDRWAQSTMVLATF